MQSASHLWTSDGAGDLANHRVVFTDSRETEQQLQPARHVFHHREQANRAFVLRVMSSPNYETSPRAVLEKRRDVLLML